MRIFYRGSRVGTHMPRAQTRKENENLDVLTGIVKSIDAILQAQPYPAGRAL